MMATSRISTNYGIDSFHWYIVGRADHEQPPEGQINIRIQIGADKDQFLFTVNGENYKFSKETGEEIDLFHEFKKGLKLGWFNEIDPVKLSNIQIS